MREFSCHCGDVKIEVDIEPTFLTQCNCSICRRYVAIWGFFTRSSARLVSNPEKAALYLWGDEIVEFYHCASCGCVTHYEGVDKTPEERFAVNFRLLVPDDYADITVRTFDGADTWQYLD